MGVLAIDVAFFSCYQVMSPSGKERKGRRKGGGREAHEKVELREEGKITKQNEDAILWP